MKQATGKPRISAILVGGCLPLFLIVFYGVEVYSQQAVRGTEPNCITCHQVLEGPGAQVGVIHDFRMSSHALAGLGCSDCHGGNPHPPADLETFDYAAAKGPGTGFIGSPLRTEVTAFCSRCHSDPEYMRRFAPQLRVDQERLYWTSGHGQAHQQGNERAAICVDCHTSHRILPASDPRSTVAPRQVPATCASCHAAAAVMTATGHPTSVIDDYEGSVHGQALLVKGESSAPACNDCHGNHGAAPPGVTSVSAVCSQCHVSNASDFRNSPHGPIFEAMGEPQCEACHGYHAIEPTSDAMLEPDGVCAVCHVSGDVGMETAGIMLAEYRTLEALIEEARELLEGSRRKGVLVEPGVLLLQRAWNSLIRGRAAVHTFTLEGVQEVTAPGIEAADQARQVGLAGLQEFEARRQGWSLFLLVSLMVIIGLVVLIRRLERPGGPYPLKGPE